MTGCGFFLASGRCSGVGGGVEKLAEGRDYLAYIFDLGVY